MVELPWWIIAIVGAVIGALGLGAVRGRRQRSDSGPSEAAIPSPPPEPITTANEVKDELATDTADAITSAAADHNVSDSVVADLVDAADRNR